MAGKPFLMALTAAAMLAQGADRILIFTKTAGYREDNIAPARLALKTFFERQGLAADTSENAGLFTDTALARYKTLVFLKTSGDILNSAQQAAFEKFFRAGGGFMAIHSALDTEFDWTFYGKIIGGAYYKSLGADQKTKETVVVEDTADPSTYMLPRRWERTDEVYHFLANPRASKDMAVHVLLTVDESTYPKGVAGTDHPMSWYGAYQGGRAWVTAMGHTTASYTTDSLFLGHLWGGMQYTLARTTAIGPIAAKAARKRTRGARTPLYGKYRALDIRGRRMP